MSDNLHECPAEGCDRQVAWNVLACRRDWARLPRDIRNAVNHAWHDGDLDAHAEARADAVAWWKAHPL